MRLNELITISSVFYRSINVRYDLHDAEKVSSYIPTGKSEIVLENILSALHGISNDGASMLVGSYGTGKSHLATFLGSLIGKKVDYNKFIPVLEKIKSQQLKNLLLKELMIDKPFLVVPISGNLKQDINQLMINSLRRTIIENGLNITIESSYKTALDFIEKWRYVFPDTFESFQHMLLTNNYKTVNDLIKGLNDFDLRALNTFVDIYPKLSSGAKFNFFDGDVADVYRDVCLELTKKNFRGIFVVFDEFNKIMDTSLQNSNTLKTLQDLAELASRPDENFKLHLLLVSHRTIGQYLDQITNNMADEWRKIEGRFKIYDVSNKPWETYDLISRVIHKKIPDYYEVITKKNKVIKQISEHRRLKNIFEGLPTSVINDTIIRGCLPLHPLTVFILPRVSAKLAQNERTLFTFLSGKDESPMLHILDQEIDNMKCIMPWQVFDYFEHQLRWSKDASIKSIWTQVANAIEVLPSDAYSEIHLLKTIAIFKVAGNTVNLPCTLELIEYALGHDEFNNALKSLKEKKLIYIHQSNNEIEIVQPTDIDIENEIELWIKQKPVGISALSYMAELGIQHYVIPHRYNYEYKMTRFLTPVYVDIYNIKNVICNNKLSPMYDHYDGIICYMFPETIDELSELEKIAKGCHDKRAFFVIPIYPVPIKNIIWRILALNNIKNAFKLKKADIKVKTLIDLYIEDHIQHLNNKLGQVVIPSNEVKYYWCGEQKLNINSERSLSSVVSKMLEEVYTDTPVINNELINKNNPTQTSRKARNEVIDYILKGYTNLRSRCRSTQEMFMLETLFFETGIINKETETICTEKTSFYSIFETIDNFFLSAQKEPKRFKKLLMELFAPPFGVRKGIIPVLLASSIVKYKQFISIRDITGNDCYIDAYLLEKIIESPDNYFVKLDDWNENCEELAKELAKLFNVNLPTNIILANEFTELVNEIFRWFTGLPKYSRETNNISEHARIFRYFARIANRNPKQILFHDLPKALGYKKYTVGEIKELIKIIKESKTELDNILKQLLEDIKEILKAFFDGFGFPQESIISLARNMVETLSLDNHNSIEWSNMVAFISGYEGYDEERFIYGLAHILTGIRLEDWLDKTVDDFKTILDEMSKSRQQIASTNFNGPKVEMLFWDSAYNKKKITLFQCKVTELGEMLQSHIESAIENFGDAISPLEKRQILLNVIKKHL